MIVSIYRIYDFAYVAAVRRARVHASRISNYRGMLCACRKPRASAASGLNDSMQERESSKVCEIERYYLRDTCTISRSISHFFSCIVRRLLYTIHIGKCTCIVALRYYNLASGKVSRDLICISNDFR